MKTDTEYFHLAVDAWCKKHRFDSNLPATPSWFSEMLRDAQTLKAADRARVDAEGSPTA